MASRTRAISLLPLVIAGVLVVGCAADSRGAAAIAAVARPATVFHVPLASDIRPTTRSTARHRLEATEVDVNRGKSLDRRAIASETFSMVRMRAKAGGFVCQMDMS